MGSRPLRVFFYRGAWRWSCHYRTDIFSGHLPCTVSRPRDQFGNPSIAADFARIHLHDVHGIEAR